MRAVSKTGCEAEARREGDGGRVRLGDVDGDRAVGEAPGERAEEPQGVGPAGGDQRADLEALAADADSAERPRLAALARGRASAASRCRPARRRGRPAGRCRSRGGRARPAPAGGPTRRRDRRRAPAQACRRGGWCGRFRRNPSGDSWPAGRGRRRGRCCGRRDGRAPPARVPSRIPSTPRRPAQIEAEEAEGRRMTDDRDAGDGLLADPAHQEAARIGGEEGAGVVEAGVPALGGRPVERCPEIGDAHRRDPQVDEGARHQVLRARACERDSRTGSTATASGAQSSRARRPAPGVRPRRGQRRDRGRPRSGRPRGGRPLPGLGARAGRRSRRASFRRVATRPGNLLPAAPSNFPTPH